MYFKNIAVSAKGEITLSKWSILRVSGKGNNRPKLLSEALSLSF